MHQYEGMGVAAMAFAAILLGTAGAVVSIFVGRHTLVFILVGVLLGVAIPPIWVGLRK
jgi:hypothetical protein